MRNSTNPFVWNFYQFSVVNLTRGIVYADYDSLETARKICELKNSELKYKYAVQQIHYVSKLVY